jgi:hypothetical protein
LLFLSDSKLTIPLEGSECNGTGMSDVPSKGLVRRTVCQLDSGSCGSSDIFRFFGLS